MKRTVCREDKPKHAKPTDQGQFQGEIAQSAIQIQMSGISKSNFQKPRSLAVLLGFDELVCTA